MNEDIINDLINLSALFGSCHCLRYFLLNQTNFDNSLVKYAIAGGNTEIVEIVQNKIDDFSNYINVSLKYHQYHITKWIIDTYSADIDYVYCLRHYCFKFLIEFSQNNTQLIAYDKNFIYHCAEVGIYDLVHLLVENHYNPESRESINNETPLHAAARCNMLNICKLLLDYNADVDACDNDGWTPLMVAAYKNNLEVFQYLLEKGANIHHKDNYFESVYSIAARDIQDYIVINGLLLS
ncbi:ankyrin repeat protein, putative [Trichomonas vaginalis G3]|uniref:Ankyrin repeat protein, putative n=1 Tax=Trichomonas vaginalis (strain ATCC PRA-98 / G3) TaxID=412133 RepID=A2DV60_TRIV3|nr:histone-lysine N-methyltransferase family [Trichomonas vaginalis G3]EAY15656.1 ankyrin repeat protein, putative [Trichomonas vaginalis G3]KAI5504486.1 histone-lysine N-methyltransferase family [Trichomonas vaginalis G3]|eukprot:XP_001327879.1 ankyrin repeat protein [Trichomonas vaginalis G3]